MAVSINLYTHSKRKNSTKQPSGAGQVYYCVLKEGTDVWSPTFVLSTNPGTSRNYALAFGRYYYVDRVEYIPPHWHVSCTLDPMATWKTEIGSASLYVTRANDTSQRNENLFDALPSEVIKTVFYTTVNPSIYNISLGQYVVTIAGDNGSGDGVTHWVMSSTQYNRFWSVFNDVGSWDLPTGFQLEYVDPISHIQDVRWYPFAIVDLGNSTAIQIYVNGWNTHAYGVPLPLGTIKPLSSTIDVPRHPQASTLGNFLNSAPYSSHTWVDPIFGTISVDPTLLTAYSKITEQINVDPSCGYAHFRLTVSNPGDDSFIVADRDAEVGVSCLFSSQIVDVQGMIAGWSNGVSSLLQANPIPAITSVFGGAYAAQHPKIDTVGGIATRSKYNYTQALYSEFVTVDDIDHVTMGYPVCKTLTISSLSGFVQVAKGDVAVPGPSWAQDQIRSYLEGGFYYE